MIGMIVHKIVDDQAIARSKNEHGEPRYRSAASHATSHAQGDGGRGGGDRWIIPDERLHAEGRFGVRPGFHSTIPERRKNSARGGSKSRSLSARGCPAARWAVPRGAEARRKIP